MKKISYEFYSLLLICFYSMLFKNALPQDLSPLINYPETFNSVVFQNSENTSNKTSSGYRIRLPCMLGRNDLARDSMREVTSK